MAVFVGGHPNGISNIRMYCTHIHFNDPLNVSVYCFFMLLVDGGGGIDKEGDKKL